MSKEINLEVTNSEFLVLLRHNLIHFFKIYNIYNPNEHNMSTSAFDTLTTAYDKLTKYIDLSYGEKICIENTPVDKHKIEKQVKAILEDVKNLEEFKKASEKISTIAHDMEIKVQQEESDAYAIQKFNGYVFDVLYKYDMIAKQDSVDSAIKTLLKECGMPADFLPVFYKSVVKNANNRCIILDILDKTCNEYVNQTSLSREALNIQCKCKRKNNKNSYARKSFALLVALDAAQNNQDIRTLTVYECPEVANAWHITHENQLKDEE